MKNKILLTGYSRGGQFSHRFALANPQLVHAVAPCAAGTWTTPNGKLLIEQTDSVADPETYLANPENAKSSPARLQGIFTPRVAKVAGLPPQPGAENIPFLVMCGSLDTRFNIANKFSQSLKDAGYQVNTKWPKTPHGSRNKKEYAAEFEKFPSEIMKFFQQTTASAPAKSPPATGESGKK
ncbi:MAG: hypothetical protein AAF591_23435 [Verrucomicrobiota bacterium]